jgi:FkbM family methyltransferase
LNSVYDELQREIRAALSLITPMKVLDRSKTRVGGKHDGGYVMIDDLDGVGICYSLGVGPDTSWDLDMAQRGWVIYQYDHTVDEPPPQHPNIHFRKIGIALNDDTPKMNRLDTLVRQNGHSKRTDMILKMDIEGSEWECLDCLEDCFLSQFRQILIEIHWMDHLVDPEFRSLFTRVIGKVRQTHECVHIHANNFGRIIAIWGLPVAQVYELTFARREDYNFTENDERFPSDLDFPNNETMPDYDLGLFKFSDLAQTVAKTPGSDAESVFSRRAYNTDPARDPIKLLEAMFVEPGGIIHVGANTGQDAVRYAQARPDICVYIEPIGSLFERLQVHVNRFPGHVAVQGLCSDVDGELVEFNIANNGGASSSMFPLGEHARLYPEITYTNTETYRTTTLDSLITSRFPDAQFDLLVVDTQGSELKVLKGATTLLEKVYAIFVKVCPYPLYEGSCTYGEIDEFLRPLGFIVNWVHFYRGEWGHAFFVRKVLTFYDKRENLALGRPARLSSDYMGWGAEGGNNGMLTGKFGFHTQLEDSPWWDVDLGDIRRLREIRVFNRTDAYPDRARHLVVQISNDGDTWNEVHAQRGRIFGGLWGRPLQVPLSGQTARFVRTTLANKNYLHLDEIEVY